MISWQSTLSSCSPNLGDCHLHNLACVPRSHRTVPPAREPSLQYCWAAIGSRDCLGFENHSCADPSVVDRPDTSTAKAMTFSMAVALWNPGLRLPGPGNAQRRIGLGAGGQLSRRRQIVHPFMHYSRVGREEIAG